MLALVKKALNSGYSSLNAQDRSDILEKTSPVMAKEFFSEMIDKHKTKASSLYLTYGYQEKIAGLFYALVHYHQRVALSTNWKIFTDEFIDTCKSYYKLTDEIEDISDLTRIKDDNERLKIEVLVQKLF